MKYADATRHTSPEALAAIRRRFAGRHSIRLWPQEVYETLYSATLWPGATVHKIRDPELVRGVLLEHAGCFEKAASTKQLLRPVLGEGLITAEGEAWKRQRAIMGPAFKRGAISALAPVICKASSTAADTLASSSPEPIAVLPVMSQLTFEVIRQFSFGGAAGHGMPYDETIDALRICLDGTAANDAAALQAASEHLQKLSTTAIGSRRGIHASSPDLFAVLAEATEQAEQAIRISETEFRDNILTAIVAGHETTAVAATWTLFLLGKHPDVQDRLARDILDSFPDGPFTPEIEKLPLLERVIHEAMRLFPPIPTIARVALRPVTIHGIDISKGDVADILVYAMHRNKLLWRDPDRFDPDRFTGEQARLRSRFAYIPFGAGPRICIGSQLTHLQVSIIIATVLRSCIVLPIDGYEPQPEVRVTLQPHDGMPLRFAKRSMSTAV